MPKKILVDDWMTHETIQTLMNDILLYNVNFCQNLHFSLLGIKAISLYSHFVFISALQYQIQKEQT